jgi:uncharacterized membrane protein YoaK (UPF0700 family)
VIRHDRQVRTLAICLSALAGYVDATGFMASGGFFVSFMSGNSTRFAVGLFDSAINAAAAAALIATFVAGVFSGSVLGHLAGRRRPVAILAAIACLLALAAAGDAFRLVWPTILLLAFSMGAENAIFERDGETRVGLTYMTGSLVRIGHGLAGLVIGQRRPGWEAYMLLWLGLIGGAICGALAYSVARSVTIWLACAAAVLIAVLASRTNGEASRAID